MQTSVLAAIAKSFAARSISTLSAMTRWVCSGMAGYPHRSLGQTAYRLCPIPTTVRVTPLGLSVPRNKGSPRNLPYRRYHLR